MRSSANPEAVSAPAAFRFTFGAAPDRRLLATCPRPVTAGDLAGIFSRSMELW